MNIIDIDNIDDVVGGFTADEYEVADILVNFPALIFDGETRRNRRKPPLYWGDKKIRSPPAPVDKLQLLHDSTPPPSLENMAVDAPPTTATGYDPTGLAPPPLPPTQPDRKGPERSDSKAKRKEELLQEIHDLTHHQKLMETKLENLRLYRDKAREQKFISRDMRREEVNLTIGLTSSNPPVETISNDHCHSRIVNLDPMASQRSQREELHLTIGLASSNPPVETISDDQYRIPIVNVNHTAAQRSQMSPVIPDLNETIWPENNNGAFDDQADFGSNRMTMVYEAAVARLRRRQINKMKKSRVPRFSR